MKTACNVVAVFLAIAPMLAAAPSAAAADWPDWSIVFVAHRGGIVPGYPENTPSAYRQAIKHGAEVIEIDLRGTKDGEVVILHDDTLDRTTNGKGRVTELTLVELKKLDAGAGERIPTYEEVLQLVTGTGVKLLLDIKESPVLDKRKVVRLTEKYNATLNVIVGPRNLDDLRAFRALNPNLRTLGFIKNIEDMEPFAQAGIDIIRLWPKWIYARARAREKGPPARPAGVDHRQRCAARRVGKAGQARCQRNPLGLAGSNEHDAGRYEKDSWLLTGDCLPQMLTMSPGAGYSTLSLQSILESRI